MYQLLQGLEHDFFLQKKFILQHKFTHIGATKKTIREIAYKADFYLPKAFEMHARRYRGIIIETKGMLTPEYKLKKKLFMFKFDDIMILEPKNQKECRAVFELLQGVNFIDI